MNNEFFKELEALQALIAKHCIDQGRAQHLKKCWIKFKKDFTSPQDKTLQAYVKQIDRAFNSLQALSQAMCLASEAHLPNDKQMPKLKYWAQGLNKRVQQKKNSFMNEWIKNFATKKSGSVYRTHSVPSGILCNKVI